MIYEQTHFSTDEEAWPPLQAKAFIPLVLSQYEGELVEQTKDFVETNIATTFECKRRKVDNHERDTSTIKVTKKVVEILSPLETCTDPQFILFEGAPGMGKSVLLKEIAFLWGKKKFYKNSSWLFLYACEILWYKICLIKVTFSNYSVKEREELKKLLLHAVTMCQ